MGYPGKARLTAFGRSFSAQVRSHGKPGQVGEPGAPVLFLLGVFYGSCSEGVDRRLLRYVSCWFVDQVFVDLGVFQSGAS